MLAALRRIPLLGILALAACLNVTEPADNPTDPAKESFDASTGVDISKMTKTANGVYYLDTTVGSGDLLTDQLSVDVDYSAYLKNGLVFDFGSGVPISLDRVVPGLREGMTGMRVGGVRKIVVPSALGYRNQPQGGVPPNSTLVFDIRLLIIQG